MNSPTAKPPSAGPHQPLQRASAVVGVATGATAMIAAARAVRNFLMGFTSISGLVIGPRNCQSSNRQSSSSSSNLKDRQSARHRGAADAAPPRRRDDRNPSRAKMHHLSTLKSPVGQGPSHLPSQMTPNVFLLLNLVLAFYNVGTIWAHEVDIFRTWRLINPEDFPKVQTAHWRKLPYWIFTPVALALCGGVALVWYHPTSSPVWAIWANLICQALAIVLTAILWGQWQARLSKDPLGSRVPHEDSCDALGADAAHQC